MLRREGGNAKPVLQGWRVAWEQAANAALAQAGVRARIDHRSLQARGIERQPQPKLGPARHAKRRDAEWVRKREASWLDTLAFNHAITIGHAVGRRMLYASNPVEAAVGVIAEQAVRLVAQTVGIGTGPGGSQHAR